MHSTVEEVIWQKYLQYMVVVWIVFILSISIKILTSADHGPLVVMVRTDEGVKYSDGVLVAAADDVNSTEVQESVINARERGFKLEYSLTPCWHLLLIYKLFGPNMRLSDNTSVPTSTTILQCNFSLTQILDHTNKILPLTQHKTRFQNSKEEQM